MTPRRLFSFLVVSFITLAPVLSFAAGFMQVVPDSCNGKGGCQSVCDIAQLAQNILNDLIYLAIVTSAVLFAIAGGQYLTAGGNEGQTTRAKATFKNVLIGLIIIIAGWLIIDTLMKTLTGTNLGPWNKIC